METLEIEIVEHQNDWELAKRAEAGDRVAWRDLFDTHSDALLNLLCYQIGDREAAKDLLQETFVTALRSMTRYRGEGSLKAWLRKIAIRKALDWRKALSRRARLYLRLENEPCEESWGPVEPRFHAEYQAINSALRSLSSRQRAALLLREMEDLSFREVGQVMGCSESTARVHHHRAQEQFQKVYPNLEHQRPLDAERRKRK